MKVSTWAVSSAAHNTLTGCLCVVLSRWGSTKKLICISSSDAAWSRPPSKSPRGSTQNYFVCRKNNYEIEDRKKRERKWENLEYSRNELCQACTLWRDTEVTGSMDEISNKCPPLLLVLTLLLRFGPKKLAQIPVDYISLTPSQQSNLSSLWLRQTADSTPPLFTSRL